MEKNIHFRTVIEVMGKPREHIEKSINTYVENLKKNKEYEVISEEFAEIKKDDEQEMWTTFVELEVKTAKILNLSAFCFDYMPALIEVLSPKELHLRDVELSTFLNDLQAKLHQVDMVAKQVKAENDFLKKNMGGLLKNYVTVLLRGRGLTSEQLSQLMGMHKDKLEDFLDQLIDEGKIDLKEGVYYLQKKEE